MDKRKAFYLVYIGVAVFCVFSSGWVSVNDDLTSYLPDTTETRQGLTIMDEEFVTFGSNRVMVDNITYQRAGELAAVLETLEGVKSVGFDDTEEHYRSGAALFDLTYDGAADNQISLDAEMQVVMVVAVVIILLVLLFTSHTYMEIPVLLMTFGMAALMNKGTNFVFGEISFVSNSVAVVLQLALAIDYAIILCHRYTEERERLEAREAVVTALSKAIPEISGSSLTTLADLRAINRQFNVLMGLVIDALIDLQDGVEDGPSHWMQDTSEENAAAQTQGKVDQCTNSGLVEGDRNVGGILGSIAIEYALNPEDDGALNLSFGATYETKSVVLSCVNQGGVTGKKDCVGGVDGISYAGHAQSAELSFLQALAGVPTEFTSFRLILRADGRVIQTIPFTFGQRLSRIELPAPPEKEGCFGIWPTPEDDTPRSDVILDVEYFPWLTVISSQQADGDRSLALVDGQFTSQAVLTVADSAQSAPAGASPKANVWDVTLTGADLGDDAVLSLRLLCPGGGTVRAYRNGGWQTLDAQVNGSYLIVEMRGISETFCVEPVPSVPAALIAAAAAAVPAVLLLLVFVRKLAKKRRSAKAANSSPKDAEQEKDPVKKNLMAE